MKPLILLLTAFLFSLFYLPRASAYPDFIGYGYASCLTCHFNGSGSGPLNDYGRALWSAEIASRALYPSSMTDEDIANQSGFLGKVELPYWIRPHAKYRDLSMTTNYRSSMEGKVYYRMQLDAGATFSDPVGKYVAVITFGNTVERGEQKVRLLPREYYLRVEMVKNLWLYVGLLEKVFGIRNIDHSLFQRANIGFNPYRNSPNGNWTSQGIVVQKIEDTWEFAVNGFMGNPHDDEDFRHKGISGMGEYEVGEKKRLGGSLMTMKRDQNQKEAGAIHYRQGFEGGSSLLLEYGIIQNQNKGQAKERGSYNFAQTLIPIVRGYNLKLTAERYNADFKASATDSWRWSTGLLAFPAPRLEVRAEFRNDRGFWNGPVSSDQWHFLGQVHVSL